MEYLKHLISKVEAMKKWLVPITVKELRGFFGIVVAKWKHYLSFKLFVIKIDHKSLAKGNHGHPAKKNAQTDGVELHHIVPKKKIECNYEWPLQEKRRRPQPSYHIHIST